MRKIIDYCPLCDRVHELKIVYLWQDDLQRGVSFRWPIKYLLCEDKDELILNEKLIDENWNVRANRYDRACLIKKPMCVSVN